MKTFIEDENGEKIYLGEVAIKIWNLAIEASAQEMLQITSNRVTVAAFYCEQIRRLKK